MGVQVTTVTAAGQPGQQRSRSTRDINRRPSAYMQHVRRNERHRRRIGAVVHHDGHVRQLDGHKIAGPVIGPVAGCEVYVVVLQLPAQAGNHSANGATARAQPHTGSIPQVGRVLIDRGQALINGTMRVRANHRRWTACTRIDGLCASFFGRVLLADPACPGGA